MQIYQTLELWFFHMDLFPGDSEDPESFRSKLLQDNVVGGWCGKFLQKTSNAIIAGDGREEFMIELKKWFLPETQDL